MWQTAENIHEDRADDDCENHAWDGSDEHRNDHFAKGKTDGNPRDSRGNRTGDQDGPHMVFTNPQNETNDEAELHGNGYIEQILCTQYKADSARQTTADDVFAEPKGCTNSDSERGG